MSSTPMGAGIEAAQGIGEPAGAAGDRHQQAGAPLLDADGADGQRGEQLAGAIEVGRIGHGHLELLTSDLCLELVGVPWR